MKYYTIIFFFFFMFSCTANVSNKNHKNTYNTIDSSKDYSFDEYIRLLRNIGKNRNFPDINNFPD